jgi:hypothetical protein
MILKNQNQKFTQRKLDFSSKALEKLRRSPYKVQNQKIFDNYDQLKNQDAHLRKKGLGSVQTDMRSSVEPTFDHGMRKSRNDIKGSLT